MKYKITIEQKRVGDLIINDDLWPRRLTKIDDVNLGRIRDALRTGEKLPPPRIDRKTLIITDGCHRVVANKGLFGEDHVIEVEVVDYSSKEEMLLDAVRLNSRHGMQLDTKDRIDVILRLRVMRATVGEICQALAMTKEKYDRLMRRTASTKNGEVVALPRGAASLAETGKPLTKIQEQELPKIGGVGVSHQARMLIAQLRANVANLGNPNEVAILTELRDLLNRMIP